MKKHYNLISIPMVAFLITASLLVGCSKDIDQLNEDLQSDLAPKVTASDFSSEVPQTYMNHLLKMVKQTPGWTPPVAARGYAYTGLALYEAVQPGMDNANSMVGQITDLTSLPVIEEGEKYYWPICANEALYNIILDLMPTATAENISLLEDIYNDFDASFSTIPTEIYNRSKSFGQDIAAAVFEYSTTDGGHEGYLYNFPADYIPPTGDYAWVPTPPAYLNALQPYWGSVRPFVESSLDDAMAVPPYAFSTAPGSTMYKQALDIYNMVEESTPEMTAIALFWADDPGNTFTPPGHAWAIAKQVIDYEDANLGQAALTYGKLGLALHDAFVSCWNNKYIHNLIRPVTYIREYIDADFTTIVGTPPFPEYTSGHSTNMGAFATVMEGLYGKAYSFEDDSHSGVHPSRFFDSFDAAAYEAAISRMYGGIHYKQACVQGVICGRVVGDNINALNWKD